jgi:hypothetical protein
MSRQAKSSTRGTDHVRIAGLNGAFDDLYYDLDSRRSVLSKA